MRRVDASERPGKARALNFAIPQARGRAILLVDSDDVVAPGWLAAMANALDENDLVAAATDYRPLNEPWVLEARIRDPEARERLQRIYRFHYQMLPYVSGHCMGFTRRLFDALDGFDETYAVGDDVDFSLRAQLEGFAIRAVPEAVVYYRLRDALPRIPPPSTPLRRRPGAPEQALSRGRASDAGPLALLRPRDPTARAAGRPLSARPRLARPRQDGPPALVAGLVQRPAARHGRLPRAAAVTNARPHTTSCCPSSSTRFDGSR